MTPVMKENTSHEGATKDRVNASKDHDGSRSRKNSKPKKHHCKDKKQAKGKRDKQEKTIKLLKRGVASIEFDAVARYQHLTGFTERKRARRAYGLAQQKMKDRKAKLEHRAAIRTAERDFIDEAEKLKQQFQKEHQEGTISTSSKIDAIDDDNNNGDLFDNHEVNNTDTKNESEETIQVLFDGEETEQQWGGHVVVTTSTHIPGDSDDDDDNDDNIKQIQHKQDTDQEYAGKIEKYLKNMKGNLPSKKKKTIGHVATIAKKHRAKGQHGAINMKGVGTAADMKVAQKMLARSSSRTTKHGTGNKVRKGKR
jgi:hypothetical protein